MAAALALTIAPVPPLSAAARPLPSRAPLEAPWLAPEPGTLLELSGEGATARATAAVSLVIRAQAAGETAVWIMHDASGIYAPDLAAAGVDLDALAVVRVPYRERPKALVRAAEIALRSGGFGIAVLDLIDGVPGGPPAAWQGRLLGLAREHRARIVLLSSSARSADSLGPLVSVRVAPRRVRHDELGFVVEHDLVKVKHGALTRVAPSRHRAPTGM